MLARRRRAVRAIAAAAVAVSELRRARASADEQRYKSVGIFLYKEILELGGLWIKTGQRAGRAEILPIGPEFCYVLQEDDARSPTPQE